MQRSSPTPSHRRDAGRGGSTRSFRQGSTSAPWTQDARAVREGLAGTDRAHSKRVHHNHIFTWDVGDKETRGPGLGHAPHLPYSAGLTLVRWRLRSELRQGRGSHVYITPGAARADRATAPLQSKIRQGSVPLAASRGTITRQPTIVQARESPQITASPARTQLVSVGSVSFSPYPGAMADTLRRLTAATFRVRVYLVSSRNAIDALAQKLGIDKCGIRLRNSLFPYHYSVGDKYAYGEFCGEIMGIEFRIFTEIVPGPATFMSALPPVPRSGSILSRRHVGTRGGGAPDLSMPRSGTVGHLSEDIQIGGGRYGYRPCWSLRQSWYLIMEYQAQDQALKAEDRRPTRDGGRGRRPAMDRSRSRRAWPGRRPSHRLQQFGAERLSAELHLSVWCLSRVVDIDKHTGETGSALRLGAVTPPMIIEVRHRGYMRALAVAKGQQLSGNITGTWWETPLGRPIMVTPSPTTPSEPRVWLPPTSPASQRQGVAPHLGLPIKDIHSAYRVWTIHDLVSTNGTEKGRRSHSPWSRLGEATRVTIDKTVLILSDCRLCMPGAEIRERAGSIQGPGQGSRT